MSRSIGFIIAAGVHLLVVIVLFASDFKDFIFGHPWMLGTIAALPDIAVAVLAWLELGHSAEANRLRNQANEVRRDATRHLENLQQIAENTRQPSTWADRQAAKLRNHLGENVQVFEGNGTWGGKVQLVDVTDNIATLFSPAGYSSAQAWSQQVECKELEITESPSGPIQIKINKRYGTSVNLGEMRRWEGHSAAAPARPAFARGETAFRAEYGKQGSAERRALRVHSSADNANSFMLEASTGEEIIGDNVEVSKRVALLEIDYKAAGFTRSNSSSGGANPHRLYIS